MQIDKQVGLKVKELRIEKGWSRQTLAGLIGVTHQQLAKYETAKDRISAGRLMGIARALDINASELLDDSASPSNRNRLSLELIRNFNKINSPLAQETIVILTRNLSTLH